MGEAKPPIGSFSYLSNKKSALKECIWCHLSATLANKVVIHQERQGPEGVQGKQEGHVKEAEVCESEAPPPGPSESGDTSFMLRLAR